MLAVSVICSAFLLWVVIAKPKTSFFILLFISPFVELPQQIGFDPRLYLGLAIGIRAVFQSWSTHKAVIPRGVVRMWVLFTALAAISLWFHSAEIGAEDFEAADSIFRYFICGSLVFFAAVQFLKTIEDVRTALFCLSVAAFITASYGVWQAINDYSQGVSGRIEGFVGNPNYLAGYLAVSVSVLLLLYPSSRKKQKLWLATAMVGAGLCCIFTFSRVGTVALFAGLSTHWYLSRHERFSFRLVVAYALPVIGLILLIASQALMPLRYRVTFSKDADADRVAQAEQGVEDLSRLEAFEYGVDVTKDHAWIGAGLGTFVARNYNVNGAYVTTHDTVLEILTGTGLIGFALFLILLYQIARRMDVGARRAVIPVVLATLIFGLFADLLQAIEIISIWGIVVAACYRTPILLTGRNNAASDILSTATA